MIPDLCSKLSLRVVACMLCVLREELLSALFDTTFVPTEDCGIGIPTRCTGWQAKELQ